MKLEILSKHSVKQLSTNFNAREFACQCENFDCLYTLYSPLLIEKLEELRLECANIPINILSGFRCKKHNDFVGSTVGEQSRHRMGCAVDLAIPQYFNIGEFSKRAWKLFDVVIPYKNRKFIHCHLDPIGGNHA